MVRLTIIYGEGKGKTTYSLGHIYLQSLLKKEITVAQFLKTGKNCGECYFFKEYDAIEWFYFGKEEFFTKTSNRRDFRNSIKIGIQKLKDSFEINKRNILLLDELGVALFFKLVRWKEIQTLFKFITEEIIITGRKIPLNIRKKADNLIYVDEKKHPYNKGIEARKGIDF
ncbi:MAG: cob(I)yrinic acid a,c-diamide adenosyltransferase [Candidatus Heimdallarchaeota archaeon]|nr:cob(I)yrinic acid a,c-diamide adenosyltransferase [Candidatus Heimdallarchaeota archaeon]MCK4876528.1 cob(I)yrinic acid a,c-diamide adenosyltransferase [Candidatus Heimdallarchaeota archaeon]